MATTAGVFLMRPTFSALTFNPGQTTANFNLALRFVSGMYSGGAGVSAVQPRKSLLPRRDIAFLDESGLVAEVWYRFLQFQYEKKLGGDLAPTVPQVTTNLEANQVATATIAGTQTNIIQAVEANAASTAATIEVAVSAASPGAVQIPPPVLTVPPYIPPRKTTANEL